MFSEFFRDLNNARGAEVTVLETFAALSDEYIFEDVANIKECRYKGDIKATNKATGKEIYIEVKNDSRISQTKNVLCEDKVWYHSGYYQDGNMHSVTDIYCIVAEDCRQIIVIDFKTLKRLYQLGAYKEIQHSQQTTICYLLPLKLLAHYGGIIDIISY